MTGNCWNYRCKHYCSVDFWDFCFFSLFYTCLELKGMHCLTSFCLKKDSQFDRRKETYTKKEERKLFFACYILDIYCSLNSIIHWINLNLGHYSWNIVDIYKKRRIVVRLEISYKRSVVWLVLFVYFLVYEKQGWSKTKLLNLLKWRRTEDVGKLIQLLHKTVATSYQDATVGKNYNYLTGSSRVEIWNQKITKTLPCMQW